MPTTLVVLAHPERRSFNGAWSDATETAARAQGDRVLRSDLCQMGFDPVEGVHHYTDCPEKSAFDPLKAQERAAGTGTTPSDVQVEVDKIKQADRLVLHFPLWWFAPPAILKGWFDRAFQHGALHETNMRFDSGLILHWLSRPWMRLTGITTRITTMMRSRIRILRLKRPRRH